MLFRSKYVVRETGSTAIEADSLHYLSDLAVNVGIIVVLVVSQFGYLWLDGVGPGDCGLHSVQRLAYCL